MKYHKSWKSFCIEEKKFRRLRDFADSMSCLRTGKRGLKENFRFALLNSSVRWFAKNLAAALQTTKRLKAGFTTRPQSSISFNAGKSFDYRWQQQINCNLYVSRATRLESRTNRCTFHVKGNVMQQMFAQLNIFVSFDKTRVGFTMLWLFDFNLPENRFHSAFRT